MFDIFKLFTNTAMWRNKLILFSLLQSGTWSERKQKGTVTKRQKHHICKTTLIDWLGEWRKDFLVWYT